MPTWEKLGAVLGTKLDDIDLRRDGTYEGCMALSDTRPAGSLMNLALSSSPEEYEAECGKALF